MATTDSLEAAARKIKALQAQQAEIAEAIANLKGYLADNLPEGEHTIGSDERGWLKTVVYQSRQYNEAYGKRARPDLWDKYAVETRVLSSATAKKELTEEEYAEFQKPSAEKSVKVEVVE